jgi:hypothetical protein
MYFDHISSPITFSYPSSKYPISDHSFLPFQLDCLVTKIVLNFTVTSSSFTFNFPHPSALPFLQFSIYPGYSSGPLFQWQYCQTLNSLAPLCFVQPPLAEIQSHINPPYAFSLPVCKQLASRAIVASEMHEHPSRISQQCQKILQIIPSQRITGHSTWSCQNRSSLLKCPTSPLSLRTWLHFIFHGENRFYHRRTPQIPLSKPLS